MKKVALGELLTPAIVTVAPDVAITEVMTMMSQLGISCVVAVDAERHPLGVFTERDAVGLLAERRATDQLQMADVMSTPPLCASSHLDFRAAYSLLLEHGFRHLIVVDADNQVTGIVTEGDFLPLLDEGDLSEFKIAAKIMSCNVVTVDVDDTLASAVAIMHRNRYSCVVITRNSSPVGIMTERDAVRLAPLIADPVSVALSSIVQVPLITATPDTTLPDAIKQMGIHKIRHLVIAEQGRLLGIVTRHDLVKTLQGSYVNFLHETIQKQRSELFQLDQQRTLFKLHAAALDASANAIVITDKDALIKWANPAYAKLTGYALQDAVGKYPKELVKSGLQDHAFYEVLWQTILSGKVWHGEVANKRQDGTLFYQEMTITPVRSDKGDITHFIAIKQDISERRQTEERLREAAAVMENTHDGVVITDTTPRILVVNEAYTTITGYSAEDVIGKNPNIISSGRADKAFYAEMWACVLKDGYWQGEVWNRRKNGECYPQLLTISTIYDDKQKPVRYVGVFADITQLKENQEKLEFMAHHDPLTRLPNRSLAESRLEHEIEQAQRHSHQIAVLFIDLDRFKAVNDSFGHLVGDELLCAVSERLGRRVREGDTLGRLGGDEFILLATPLTETQDAAVIARDFIGALSEPFKLADNHEVFIGGSIGISLFPQDGTTVLELMKNADAAMYLAKKNGRNQFSFYTRELNAGACAQLAMENDLRRALSQNELLLHYQPKVDLQSGKICGMEALIRWKRRGEGWVPPAVFIPLAEKSSLILTIGSWVLEQACWQIRQWLDEGLSNIAVSINVSARQFRSGNFDKLVAKALDKHKIDGRYLELELTESMLMQEPDDAVATMLRLKQIGVKISLDDFGTGYSSFSYLSRFPIDTLKIDQSFVRGVTTESNAAEIASAIIGLAHRMNLRVIAEGVETEAQLAYLLDKDSDEIQGYHFSKALSPHDISDMLRSGKSLPCAQKKTVGVRTLLVVDDDPASLGEIQHTLQGENYLILSAGNAHAGLALLAPNQVQVILAVQHAAGMNMLEFLHKAEEIHSHTLRILLLDSCDELSGLSQAANAGITHKSLARPIAGEHLRKHIAESFIYHAALF
ncbi:MAG: EAL domain-containing protein [Gallionella sp.]|jgi:diguanylate cyclase (GGDEF)-like protein/PAS domain S-box-containing protein